MDGSEKRPVDRWLQSRLQYHIKATDDALEGFQTRRALQHAFFLLQQDMKWYVRRGGANRELLRTTLNTIVRLLAPFTPHLSEELWEMLGMEGFASRAEFPSADETLADPLAEFKEEVVKSVTGDIGEILKVTKLAPKKIVLYCAPAWKWEVFRRAVGMAGDGHLYMSGLMKSVMEVHHIKEHSKELAKFAQKIVADIPKLSKEQLLKYSLPLDEMELLSDAREFLAGEFSCQVQTFSADDDTRHDPQDKAKQAVPLRPAIFIE